MKPRPVAIGPSRYAKARAAAVGLSGMKTPLQVGLVALGSVRCFHDVIPLLSPRLSPLTTDQKIEVGLAAAQVLIAYTLAALVAGRLVAAIGRAFDMLVTQAQATARTADLFEQILLREGGRPAGTATAPSPSDLKARRLAEIRHAIKTAAWDDAGELVRAFHEAHPDDPDPARAADELAGARQSACRDLISRIDAAREANDPDRVIELRDDVKPLLASESLRALDRDLAKWFMMLIHRRLRAGSVRADVALLAGRVAASLDETPEGASLRASLPTLRRAAGLCPRCAQPYKGIADACPACLAGTSALTAASGFTPEPTDAEDEVLPDDPRNPIRGSEYDVSEREF